MSVTKTQDLTDEEQEKLIRLLTLCIESDKENLLWFGPEDSETMRDIRSKLQ